MSPSAPLRAQPPWPQGHGLPTEAAKEPAPRQEARYDCDRNCRRSPLSLPFAAGAEVPDAVDCRCGGVARRDGAPPNAQPYTPRYGQAPGGAKDTRTPGDQGTDPMSQVWKRRTPEEGRALLAERMAEVRREVER